MWLKSNLLTSNFKTTTSNHTNSYEQGETMNEISAIWAEL